MEKTRIAVAFARSASQNQDKQVESIDNQRAAIEKYANSNAFLIEAYFDNAVIEDEEILKGVLGFCKGCENINYLIVTSPTRISRSYSEYVRWKKAFRDIGVEIISATEQFDETPSGKFMECIHFMFEEMKSNQPRDSRERIEIVKERMLERVKAGYSVHRPPLGYSMTSTKGIYEPNHTGRFLANNFKLFLDNKITFTDFQRELSKISKSKETLFPISKIRKIISNPYYSGTLTYDGKQFKGLHEPLLSMAEQEQLVRLINQ